MAARTKILAAGLGLLLGVGGFAGSAHRDGTDLAVPRAPASPPDVSPVPHEATVAPAALDHSPPTDSTTPERTAPVPGAGAGSSPAPSVPDRSGVAAASAGRTADAPKKATKPSSTGRDPAAGTEEATTSTTAAPAPTVVEPAATAPDPTTTTTVTTDPATLDQAPTAFVETFAGLASLWAEGATVGRWLVRYTGGGRAGVADVDGAPALVTAPAVSTSAGETHAAMVTTTDGFGDLDLAVRVKTLAQLRRNSAPNPWEVGWVVWSYERNEHFYYVVLKPNGWELGKADDSKLDPAGPECDWPEYRNCRYAGAQRFLATGSTPFPIGRWYDVRVRQQGGQLTVWADGSQLVSFTDTENPYRSGVVGLYNEDAQVAFAGVRVERL